MPERIYRASGLASVNGTYLYYEVAGLGHPLTLVHGGLVDRRGWDDQFEVFARQYCAIRYDMRSFGNSAAATEPYSQPQDLYDLLQFLGTKQTYLMGLSMGGALAIDFTLEHPELVDALILVASSMSGFKIPDTTMQRISEIDTLLEQGEIEQAVELENRLWTDGQNRTPEQVKPGVRERVHEMNRHNYLVQQEETAEPLDPEINAINRLAEIHVPTLIIVGDHDVPYILQIADLLANGIAGSQKVVVPNTAHHLHMEEPELFNRIVLDFLAKL